MQECFGIASFRSRQQVLKFEAALRREGIRVSIVTTPRDVAVGCGLSVRYELEELERARSVYRRLQPSNLIGFYKVCRTDGNRSVSTPFS